MLQGLQKVQNQKLNICLRHSTHLLLSMPLTLLILLSTELSSTSSCCDCWLFSSHNSLSRFSISIQTLWPNISAPSISFLNTYTTISIRDCFNTFNTLTVANKFIVYDIYQKGPPQPIYIYNVDNVGWCIYWQGGKLIV